MLLTLSLSCFPSLPCTYRFILAETMNSKSKSCLCVESLVCSETANESSRILVIHSRTANMFCTFSSRQHTGIFQVSLTVRRFPSRKETERTSLGIFSAPCSRFSSGIGLSSLTHLLCFFLLFSSKQSD